MSISPGRKIKIEGMPSPLWPLLVKLLAPQGRQHQIYGIFLSSISVISITSLLLFSRHDFPYLPSPIYVYLVLTILVTFRWSWRVGIVLSVMNSLLYVEYFASQITGVIFFEVLFLSLACAIIAQIARLGMGQAEEHSHQLQLEDQRLQAILSNMAHGVLVLDEDENICIINPVAEYLLDTRRDDIIGHNGTRFIFSPADDLLLVKQQLMSGEQINLSKQTLNKVLSISCTALRDQEQNFKGTVAVIRDITEQNRLDRIKTEFIATASHELRTPLTVISGYTEMLLEDEAGSLNAEQHNFLSMIQSNTERLSLLMRDLLDVSRIEEGELRLSQHMISIINIIESAVTLMRPEIERKSQKLFVCIEPDIPEIYGDSDRLIQLLTNLLSNARKFTPVNGHININAEVKKTMLNVSVSDTGIGLAKEDIDRLFDKFFRVEDSATRQTNGTGLGLVICRGIARLHGGDIEVASELGQGSTFTLMLPLANKDSEDVTPAA